MKTDRDYFSKEMGFAVQSRQMFDLKNMCDPGLYKALQRRVNQENLKLTDNDTGYDVYHGASLDTFISNWNKKQAKKNSMKYENDRIICFDYNEIAPVKDIVASAKKYKIDILFNYDSRGSEYVYVFAKDKKEAVKILKTLDFSKSATQSRLSVL